MPVLNKAYQIEISPEQFVNACTDNEIQELRLLLYSPRFNSSVPDNSENSVHNIGQSGISGLKAGKVYREVLNECVKLFGEHPLEALQVIGEIGSQTGIPLTEVLQAMKLFKKLEALRVKHLVDKPQTLIEEEIK